MAQWNHRHPQSPRPGTLRRLRHQGSHGPLRRLQGFRRRLLAPADGAQRALPGLRHRSRLHRHRPSHGAPDDELRRRQGRDHVPLQPECFRPRGGRAPGILGQARYLRRVPPEQGRDEDGHQHHLRRWCDGSGGRQARPLARGGQRAGSLDGPRARPRRARNPARPWRPHRDRVPPLDPELRRGVQDPRPGRVQAGQPTAPAPQGDEHLRRIHAARGSAHDGPHVPPGDQGGPRCRRGGRPEGAPGTRSRCARRHCSNVVYPTAGLQPAHPGRVARQKGGSCSRSCGRCTRARPRSS